MLQKVLTKVRLDRGLLESSGHLLQRVGRQARAARDSSARPASRRSGK
jgi:hypothetical protein